MPRIVYSVRFETAAPRDGLAAEFIVPLDRRGNSPNINPLGQARVVELRPGDSFLHRPTQKRYQLAAMEAYRQHHLSHELVAAGTVPAEGYLVPK